MKHLSPRLLPWQPQACLATSALANYSPLRLATVSTQRRIQPSAGDRLTEVTLN